MLPLLPLPELLLPVVPLPLPEVPVPLPVPEPVPLPEPVPEALVTVTVAVPVSHVRVMLATPGAAAMGTDTGTVAAVAAVGELGTEVAVPFVEVPALS